LLKDLRHALRNLRRSAGFSCTVISTLALGIGANTAIFSVVYAALLKPLPYANPGELVSLSGFVPDLRSRFPSMAFRARDVQEFRRSNSVFSAMAALRSIDFNLTGDPTPERVHGARVSANFFSLLGVQPKLGRAFLPEEDDPGRDRVVVISHDLWTRRFSSDPGVLKRALLLNGERYVVAGVMPSGFLFPTGKKLHPRVPFGPRVDVWKPMAFTPQEIQQGGNWVYGVIARLNPGTTPDQARENLDAIAAGIPFPDGRTKLQTQVTPLHEAFSGDVRQGLVMLLGAVGLLLLIACVNLANLLLARSSARSRDGATRAALGAPMWRLSRQALTESILLALLGAAAGLLLAVCGSRLLALLGPVDSPAVQSSQLNGPVLIFTVVVALATGVAFGLIPALETARGDLYKSLAGRDATAGRRTGRLHRILVAAEVALSTGILVVAGLLLLSFVKVTNVDKGFAVERILTADFTLPEKLYPRTRRISFYREIADRMRGLPGVDSAGVVSAPPLGAEANRGESGPVYLETDTTPEHTADRPLAAFPSATRDYYAAMEIPVLAGRLPEDKEAARVVAISASLAEKLWPSESFSSVVGRRIKLNHPSL
jgi:putative ABC transport system permease protein